jgi:hypothetical protein
LALTKDNLAPLCAIATHFGHIKSIDSLKCARDDSCLLAPPDRFESDADKLSNIQGAYLYYHAISCAWIRSGKVVGRSIVERHVEHKKAASLTTDAARASKFYRLYPDKDSSQRTGDELRK